MNLQIKGFDFKFGGAVIHNNNSQFVNALILGIPKERSETYNMENASLDSGASTTYTPVRIRITTVISNGKSSPFWLFHKTEFGFGLAYEIVNAGKIHKNIKNITYSSYPWVVFDSRVSYSYQCEGLDFNFQFSSRPFAGKFALIGGINSSFGLNTYKRYEIMINSDDIYNIIDLSHNVPYFNVYGNLGLKYNFSCELNLFAQAETGFIRYGKQIGGTSIFEGFAFGIRYKIIDEQDRAQYKNSAFW